jgi:trehalose-6-phosphatase
MLSQARGLASSHGYTVLQAVQEWHSSKGSSKAMPLGEVIEKFLAAKSNRSPAYMVTRASIALETNRGRSSSTQPAAKRAGIASRN